MDHQFLYQGKKSFWKYLLIFTILYTPFILQHIFNITDLFIFKWFFLIFVLFAPWQISLSYTFTIQHHQSSNRMPIEDTHTFQHHHIQKVTYQKIHFIVNWYFICIHYLDYKNQANYFLLCCNMFKGSASHEHQTILQSYQKLNIQTQPKNVKFLDWIFNDGESLSGFLRIFLSTIVLTTLIVGSYTLWIHSNYIIIPKQTLGFEIIFYSIATAILIYLMLIAVNKFIISKRINTETSGLISVIVPITLICIFISYNYISSIPKQADFFLDSSSSNFNQEWLFENYSLRLSGYEKNSKTSLIIPIKQGRSNIIFIEKKAFKERFKPKTSFTL